MDITKKGTAITHMLFEKNRKNVSCYSTPFGEIVVGIQANHFAVDEQADSLKVNVDYNFGVNTQFRSPDFADAYTYANALNTALSGDGLPARYNAQELDAFRTGIYPYDYPNVDWWNETLNNTGLTHNLKMSFSGGSDKFRFTR